VLRAVVFLVCSVILLPLVAAAQTDKPVPVDRPAGVQITNMPGDDPRVRVQTQRPPDGSVDEQRSQDESRRESGNEQARREQTDSNQRVHEPDIEFQDFVTSSLGYRLPIFGQNLFRTAPSTFAPLDRVPVTPDYLIGPGDELLIRGWPMIYYPLQILVDAGITEIMVVTGGNHSGEFLRLLRNGKDFGLRSMSFAYQEGEGGIADALKLAEPFVNGDSVCVVLGDNIIENDIVAARKRFDQQAGGAMIMLKDVPDPERFGVPVFEGERLVRIEEKPRQPKSNYAVIGVYFYDSTVFDRVRELKPSSRNELEITDVNNSYLSEGKLSYSKLNGWWTDAGTFESLFRASELVRKKVLASQETLAVGAGAGR
jgi:glucose-1-phosphate thymidylyltransferase